MNYFKGVPEIPGILVAWQPYRLQPRWGSLDLERVTFSFRDGYLTFTTLSVREGTE